MKASARYIRCVTVTQRQRRDRRLEEEERGGGWRSVSGKGASGGLLCKKTSAENLPIRDYDTDHKYTQPYKYLSLATPLA